jgi:predicted XRE-type DNA-binding protein
LIVERFDSVWEALGIPPQEAANLNARAELMIEIRRVIRDKKWSQAAAAKHCCVSQPRINDLLRGKIDKFSVDALVNMAGALGHQVSFTLKAA